MALTAFSRNEECDAVGTKGTHLILTMTADKPRSNVI